MTGHAVLVLALISIGGCGTSHKTTGSGPTGPLPAPSGQREFSYVALDRGGAEVVSGSMEIAFTGPDSSGVVVIAGTWSTQRVGGDESTGPQVGSGRLSGTITKAGEVRIDLNPGWADNNVYLSGHGASGRFDRLEGTWSHSTFVGSAAGGTFRLSAR